MTTSSSLPLILLLITTISFGTLTFSSNAQFIASHNAARSAVGVGPVAWDARLAAYAQSYADKRAAGDCSLVHSGGPYGENLAWSSGDLSAADAVAMWVGERAYYNYNSNRCAPGKTCGHYTQVVWRRTTSIGCAKAACRGRSGTFVNCSYNPPGNYVGQKPY